MGFLLPEPDSLLKMWNKFRNLWREPRTRGRGFIVMEDQHEEDPVAVTEVPEDPVNGIRAEDDGKNAQIDDNHDGAGQQNHQRHKYLYRGNRDEGLEILRAVQV